MNPIETVLELENVTMQFGGVVAVDSFSMHVDQGEIVALIGPNGAGKTTAFNVITGVYAPTNGNVKLRGQISATWKLPAPWRRNRACCCWMNRPQA